MDELIALLIALFARTAGERRRAAERLRSAKAQTPPVNRLAETLKAASMKTPPVVPSPRPAPQPAAAVASPSLEIEPPASFALIDAALNDDVLVRPLRRKRSTTLATLRSSQGLLGAIVASEILAPPLAVRSERHEV